MEIKPRPFPFKLEKKIGANIGDPTPALLICLRGRLRYEA